MRICEEGNKNTHSFCGIKNKKYENRIKKYHIHTQMLFI